MKFTSCTVLIVPVQLYCTSLFLVWPPGELQRPGDSQRSQTRQETMHTILETLAVLIDRQKE